MHGQFRASRRRRVDVPVEKLEHVVLGQCFEVFDVAVDCPAFVIIKLVHEQCGEGERTLVKLKRLTRDMRPKPRCFLLQILHFLQALVDQ